MKHILNFNRFKLMENISLTDLNMTQDEINEILFGYLECAIFTEEERLQDELNEDEYDEGEYDDEDDDDEIEKLIRLNTKLHTNFDGFIIDNFDIDSKLKAYNDIKQFLADAGEEAFRYAIEENGLGRLGHDIWYTRNGHGAGFFDHSYDPDIEEVLGEAGKKLRTTYMYIDGSDKLCFE